MKFEVVNRFGKTMARYMDYSCIPEKDVLENMYNAEYRFKFDGKEISLKKAKELLKKKQGGTE